MKLLQNELFLLSMSCVKLEVTSFAVKKSIHTSLRQCNMLKQGNKNTRYIVAIARICVKPVHGMCAHVLYEHVFYFIVPFHTS